MTRPPKKLRRELRILTALALAAGASRGPAQNIGSGIYQEDPLWTLLVPHLSYIKTDVEAQRSTYHSSAGGNVPDLTWLTVEPSVGIEWRNYIYHPDLLTYSLLFEPGYYWQQTQSGDSSYQTRELILNGHGSVNILTIKPYATTFSYSRSHQDVQYDFFNSQIVDSQNWGVFTGYREGPVPVTVNFEQLDEQRNAYNQNFDTSQIKLEVRASNKRKKQGLTDLDYQFNQYDNQSWGDGNAYSSESSSHHITLTDSEHFKKSALSTVAYFTKQEWDSSDSSELNATLNYNLEHTPHLHSFYIYSFGDDFGNGYDSLQNNALAGISHQLYDSLFTRLNVHGSTLNSSFAGSSIDATSIGTSGSVDYTKRLGDWAHLSVNNGATYDFTDQHASGSQTTIPNESYTLPTSGPLIIRLRTPGDVAITSITKNNVPLDSSEWQAITSTDPWQVQFFSGGAHSITNGDVLSITYVVQSNPSGNYSVFTYQGQISLRFWGERAGIHAGYNRTVNYTDTPGFILQDIEEFDAGADITWNGLSANASYINQRATYSSTRTFSLNESYSRPIPFHSTVGVNFSQQWNNFSGGTEYSSVQAQDMTFYSYMLHYDWHPFGNFSLNTEAGYQQQRGGYYNEDLFATRAYLNWHVGKLEFHMGYQHDDQQFTTETRNQDYVFLRMRRNF